MSSTAFLRALCDFNQVGSDVQYAVIGFALKCARDLHGLDVAFEHLGEGSFNEPAEAPFEGLEDSHEASLPALWGRSYLGRVREPCVLA